MGASYRLVIVAGGFQWRLHVRAMTSHLLDSNLWQLQPSPEGREAPLRMAVRR